MRRRQCHWPPTHSQSGHLPSLPDSLLLVLYFTQQTLLTSWAVRPCSGLECPGKSRTEIRQEPSPEDLLATRMCNGIDAFGMLWSWTLADSLIGSLGGWGKTAPEPCVSWQPTDSRHTQAQLHFTPRKGKSPPPHCASDVGWGGSADRH